LRSVLFRFACAYFVLDIVPFPLPEIPTVLPLDAVPRPSRLMRRLVAGGLRLRARVLRRLPARRRPRFRTEMRHPTYPEGYSIERLGPPLL